LKTYKNGMINNDVTVWISFLEKSFVKMEKKRLIIPVSWGISCLETDEEENRETTKCEQDEEQRHKISAHAGPNDQPPNQIIKSD
jgi:hypothetical protein